MPHQCTACGHTFADGSKDMLSGCPDCGGNKFQFYPPGTDVPDEPPEGIDEEAPEPEAEPSSAASTVGRAATRVRDFVSSAPAPGTDSDEAVGGDDGSTPSASPDPDAPWPDASDAADPIRRGGVADDDDSTSPAAATGDADISGAGGEDIIDADARATREAVTDAEDLAQADARSDLASEAEVEAAASDRDEVVSSVDQPADADRPADADSVASRADDGADLDPRETSSGDLEAAEATVDRGDGDTPPGARDGRVVSEPTGDEPDISELREQLNDQFESIKILEPGQYELNLMELYDREEYIIALQENGRYVIQVPENWMGDRPDE